MTRDVGGRGHTDFRASLLNLGTGVTMGVKQKTR